MGNSSSAHNHEPLDRHGGFQRGTYGDAINTVRKQQQFSFRKRRKDLQKMMTMKIIIEFWKCTETFFFALLIPILIILPICPSRNPPHSARARNRHGRWTVCVDPSGTRSGEERTACPSPPNRTSGNPMSRPCAPPPAPSPSSTWAASRSTSPGACRSARRR